MRCGILFLVCVMLIGSGCSSGERPVQSFIENPPTVLKDTAFTQYQEELNDVESRYLAGEIDYAQYMAEKKEIEHEYDRKVQHRDSIIHGE